MAIPVSELKLTKKIFPAPVLAEPKASGEKPVVTDGEARESTQDNAGKPPAPAFSRTEVRGPDSRGGETLRPAPQKPPERARSVESLPDSPEIEKALLATILQRPQEAFAAFDHCARKEFFSDPVNRDIFETAHGFFTEKGQLDLIAFTAFLSDNGKLAKFGGPAPLTDLFIRPASLEMLEYYVGELREKYIRRQIMVRSFSLASKAKSEDVSALLTDMARNVDDLRSLTSGLNGSSPTQIGPYMEADTHHDKDCLVGNRWIVRGGSTLWAGSPGIGKSSLIMQLVLYWAKGETIFGLRPTRPLKSLIIQAENDFLDVSEQVQGIAHALSSVEGFSVADLEDKVWIAQCNGVTGWQFLSYLETVLSTYQTDLVWIDPLFAFAGVDLMNAEKTGNFLRVGLFPLAAKHEVSLQVAHHIGKRNRDPQAKEQLSDDDMQFLGFGTSELQNAFRAVNILIPEREPNLYKLCFSKRGERARAKHPNGDFARNIFLKHAHDGICWLQTDEPQSDKPTGREGRFKVEDICRYMEVTTGIKTGKLFRVLHEETGMSRATFFRLFDQLKDDKKIKETEHGWSLVSEVSEVLRPF